MLLDDFTFLCYDKCFVYYSSRIGIIGSKVGICLRLHWEFITVFMSLGIENNHLKKKTKIRKETLLVQ